jgi:ABC-2 type transport system permease protein
VAGLSGKRTISDRAGALSALARQQYAALIWVQTRIFLNSFRTARGGFELGARVLTGLLFFIIAFGPAFGMGFGAYVAADEGRRLGIAILLWVLFVLWQFFSAMAPALAGQNPDLGYLLRYPVSFGSWMALYLAYGVIAPSTLIGIVWTTAIGIGITIARPELVLWTALTLGLFAFFNILLARTILAWIQRWMAQRRTREIVTAIFLFLGLGLQVFNPALHQHGKGLPYGLSRQKVAHVSRRFMAVEAVFPPGNATEALTQSLKHDGSGVIPLGGLALYTVAVGGLLGLRLRSESRGESFSEAPRASSPSAAAQSRRRPAIDFSGPVAAVFEKDLRYLMRSGPMLYALAAPLAMVFLFGGTMRVANAPPMRGAYALPLGIAWAFVGLTRLVNNNLGGEGEGLSFYFISPTPLRSVILGKNALHLGLFLVEALVISWLVIFRFGPPAPALAAATLAWLLFAIPASLVSGNLLSILMPYRMSMTKMRNEPGAIGNGLVSLLAQAAILGTGALVYFPCAAFDRDWLATPILLLLAAGAVFAYLRILSEVDGMIQARRDSLSLEIAKAPAQ